jgi:peptidoglycan/xylan/chitin deacetylase (PgdA/CDA1 family)
MYHRFNENKYPSTNIRMNVFKEQMEIIKNSSYTFSNPKTFSENFKTPKTNKEILVTIDDAFLSFYLEGLAIFKGK